MPRKKNPNPVQQANKEQDEVTVMLDTMRNTLREDGFHFEWGFIAYPFQPPFTHDKVLAAWREYSKEKLRYGTQIAHDKMVRDLNTNLDERIEELKHIKNSEEAQKIKERISALRKLTGRSAVR